MNASIAICTWNRSAALADTLAQLEKLRIPAGIEWEVLVVNNNCTDDTDGVCEWFRNRLPLRLLHEATPGQSYARNLAIREARGSVICWTDDDVIVDPEWLAALLDAFATHQATWVFGPSAPEWLGAAPTWYSPRFEGYFAVLNYGSSPFVVKDMTRPFYGLNFAGTTAAHQMLGGFRTEFGFKGTKGGVGEDVDLFQRAMQAGMKIVYTPDAHVRHVIPPGRVAKYYHRRRQWVANPVMYRHLNGMFPDVPWLLGMPRFFYGGAVRDAAGYVRGLFTGNSSERFYHELRLLRFIRFVAEAARRGFTNPPPAATPGPPHTEGGVANL
jgi:glucosyl-dolichyl phosphate glucuronosyltransferase